MMKTEDGIGTHDTRCDDVRDALRSMERAEALETASKSVSATLDLLAQATFDHVEAPLVLHMLSAVLNNPEVLV